jgi:hypothetical protein
MGVDPLKKASGKKSRATSLETNKIKRTFHSSNIREILAS